MARSTKSPKVIDGLASIRAIRRAGDSDHAKKSPSHSPPVRSPDNKSSGNDKSKPIAAHARRTSMPTKHDMLCYECGYEFAMHGALRNVVCPKCHIALCADDIIIDKSGWSTDVKTVTNVIIKKGVTVNSCDIVARNITIGGNAERAVMHIGNDLVVEEGAVIDFNTIEFKNLSIKEKADISLQDKLTCCNLDISGVINGDITATGMVTVKCGGLFRGKLKSGHFAVEEGGGVIADLQIQKGTTDKKCVSM